MNSMKTLFVNISNFGMRKGLSGSEIKITKLLNQLSLTWLLLLVFFIITDIIILDDFIPTMSGHLVMGGLIIIVFFLQKKERTSAARLLFILSAYGEFYVFANYFMKGQLVELFYILLPMISILMFNQRWIHYTWLLISIISFVLPNQINQIYSDTLFSDPTTVPIFFIGIFLIVVYFKNMNLSNEKVLEGQKNEAEEAANIIKKQKKEIENVYNQQKQFFINVAHEIRTPLTIIKGNNDIIKKKQDSEETDIIKGQLKKIQQIVDDVLDLAKLDTDQFSLQNLPIDFKELVKQVKGSFESSFQSKSIQLEYVDNTNEELVVTGDNRYLQRSINNILSNALKYTHENGHVKILLSKIENTVEVLISDSGIGVKAEECETIFNRFFQSDNSINKSGGSGIGLSFTKEIIQQHNGAISVLTQNKGTTFKVTLPLSSSEGIVQEEFKLEEKSYPKLTKKLDGKCILVVEDNQDMTTYLNRILSDYRTINAKDGKDALALLNIHKNIDLIITDYMMPNLNGYELIKQLRKQNNSLPVIMLTAKSDSETRIEVLRLGIGPT